MLPPAPPPACRICLDDAETEESGPIVRPCACSDGSHSACLIRWQEDEGRRKHAVPICEICKAPLAFRESRWARDFAMARAFVQELVPGTRVILIAQFACVLRAIDAVREWAKRPHEALARLSAADDFPTLIKYATSLFLLYHALALCASAERAARYNRNGLLVRAASPLFVAAAVVALPLVLVAETLERAREAATRGRGGCLDRACSVAWVLADGVVHRPVACFVECWGVVTDLIAVLQCLDFVRAGSARGIWYIFIGTSYVSACWLIERFSESKDGYVVEAARVIRAPLACARASRDRIDAFARQESRVIVDRGA